MEACFFWLIIIINTWINKYDGKISTYAGQVVQDDDDYEYQQI